MTSQVVMHKKTGHLAEMTNSSFGRIIWRTEYTMIAKGELAGKISLKGLIIFHDMPEFNDYEVIGEL